MINDGYLQPGFNNYKLWKQYQVFDISDKIKVGKNIVAFLFGAGWYRGRFGIGGGQENNFGKNYGLICEIHLKYENGTEEIIASDETFGYRNGPIMSSNIYDGELFDATKIEKEWMLGEGEEQKWKQPLARTNSTALSERYSKPVIVKEKLKVKHILKSPIGHTILDLGQNITGWIVFKDTLRSGQKIILKHVEHMQNGEICHDNLKGAKQEFIYISDGTGKWIRPHFTYFGFRYVQIEGDIVDIQKDHFEAWSMYTDLETTGEYIKDVNEEQLVRQGQVPFIIPKISGRGHEDSKDDEVSAAWSDVAVIVPWIIYLFKIMADRIPLW